MRTSKPGSAVDGAPLPMPYIHLQALMGIEQHQERGQQQQGHLQLLLRVPLLDVRREVLEGVGLI